MATELLVQCLCRERSLELEARIREMSELEGTQLVEAAIWHGVAPLLHVRLHALTDASLPPQPAQRLRDQYTHCVLHNGAILEQLREIVAEADSIGCRTGALKGAYLAYCVYDEPGARSLNDIDLLVPLDEIERLQDHLLSLGYAPTEVPGDIDFYHLASVSRNGSPDVELHRDLAPAHAPFQTDIDGLWDRLASTSVEGFALSHPAHDDVLLHVCAHTAFNHEFLLGLRGACDVDALVRRFDHCLDWHRLVRTANADGRAPYVYVALRVAQQMIQTPVPAHVLTSLEHGPADDGIVEEAIAFILSMEEAIPVTLQAVQEAESVKSQLQALWRGIFPPPEIMRRIYSTEGRNARILLYYAIRPFDLLRRRGAQVLGLVRGSQGERSMVEKDDNKRRIHGWARGESRNP